jgi:hypothetical protein
MRVIVRWLILGRPIWKMMKPIYKMYVEAQSSLRQAEKGAAQSTSLIKSRDRGGKIKSAR